MGGWAEDGKTYYIGQRFRGTGGIMAIIDVTDPYNAKWLLNWTFSGDGRPHDVNTSKDGTRLYAAQPGNFGAPPNNSSFGPDGLVILDVSDIQLRLPNPQIRVISRLFWDDQGQAEQLLPFFSHGRSYLISTDEYGGQGGVGGLAAACARGASPYGYSNIIDITDETNPRIVSKIMLEVHDPTNCAKFLAEPTEVGGGTLDYSTERCALDRPTIRRWSLAAQRLQALAFTTFAIHSILPRSRTGRGRLRERPSFPDPAVGHRASIKPSKSKLVWRALSKFLPLTGKGTSCISGSSVMPAVFRCCALPTGTRRRRTARQSSPKRWPSR